MEFESILKYPPKNAWTAVLTQLLCWSFRRFCVEFLCDSELDRWDSFFSLITEYAPPQFHPHLDHWLAPEQIANIPDLNAYFHSTLDKLNKSIEENDEETQDKIASFFDEEMGPFLEKWLGPVYAPFSLFPLNGEPDTEINMTKLNAIVYLLGRQPSLYRRRTMRETRRTLTPVRTQLRKTRRNKQNEILQLYLRSEVRNADIDKDNDGKSEEGKGGEERHSEEERASQSEKSPSHEE
jgi:hypothetical protein